MLFLDFDGTLADVWERYFKVFLVVTGADNVDFEQYKKYKKSLCKDSLVANKLGIELPEKYFERKKELLENVDFLNFDKLLISKDILNYVLKSDNAMLLVKRRNESNFLMQLEHLGVFVNKYKVISDGSKKEFVQKYYSNEKSIIIGDSLFDLEVGTLPCVTPFMVGYGLFEKKIFNSLNVEYGYLKNPKDLSTLLQKI